LRDFAPKNWRICGAACQLLWNLTRGSFLSSTHEDDLKSFVRMLQQLLGEFVFAGAVKLFVFWSLIYIAFIV